MTMPEGRPKKAEQLVVMYLRLSDTVGTDVAMVSVEDQIVAAHKAKKDEYRICVHGMKVSRRAKVKRLACTLCEKRVAEGKPLLWGSK